VTPGADDDTDATALAHAGAIAARVFVGVTDDAPTSVSTDAWRVALAYVRAQSDAAKGADFARVAARLEESRRARAVATSPERIAAIFDEIAPAPAPTAPEDLDARIAAAFASLDVGAR